MDASQGPRLSGVALGALLFLAACVSSPRPSAPLPPGPLVPSFPSVQCPKPEAVALTPQTLAENFSGPLFTQMGDTGVRFVKSRCPQSGGQVVQLGGGVAVGDYDNDGDLDLYFVQGGPNVLYRNEGGWRFTDVTSAAGVGDPGEGRAAAWGDFDNDGCPDLYVGNMRSRNVLYHNNCNSTFTDVTGRAGVGYAGHTFHVAWGDYDRDGCLDLYAANYLNPGLYLGDPYATYRFDRRDGEPNVLYRNNCDGTFTDATRESGAGDTGYSLAAAWTDLDGDGWPDLYIADDFGSNVLLRNTGDGRFVDATAVAGAGYRGNGMGVDSGDYDNDGDLDLYVPNVFWFPYLADVLGLPPGSDGERRAGMEGLLQDPASRALERLPDAKRESLAAMAGEGSFLGRNVGSGKGAAFRDAAGEAGVHRVEWGWGGVFFDADNDGWLDLYVANGMDGFQDPNFRRLPNRFFLNLRNGTFADRTAGAGAADRGDSRGVAYGDLDNDGDLDLAVVNYLGPARLYRNDAGSQNHWLIVKPVGACGPDHRRGASPANCSNRGAIGARVTLKAGNLTLLREVKSGSGFASNSMIPVHFGLGAADVASHLEVRWPSGKITRLADVKADQILTVREPG